MCVSSVTCHSRVVHIANKHENRLSVLLFQQEVVKKDWMFKLVGKETFTVGSFDTRATIHIEALTGFSYEYSLEIDGKSLEKFIDDRSKITKTWVLQVDGADCRVVLGKPQQTDYSPTASHSYEEDVFTTSQDHYLLSV